MADHRPEIVLLFARSGNGVIGADSDIPWYIPADLRRFKAMTMGTPMLMGRRTSSRKQHGVLADRSPISCCCADRNWWRPAPKK